MKNLLSWGSNPQNETKTEEIYGDESLGKIELLS